MLGAEQQKRLAEALLAALEKSGAVVFKAPSGTVCARIAALLQAEQAQGEDLEAEAQKLLDLHLKNAPTGVDRHKLLQMIKQRLAVERGSSR